MSDNVIVYLRRREDDLLSDYFGLERPVPRCCVPGLRI